MIELSHNNMRPQQHFSCKRSISLIVLTETRNPLKRYDVLMCSGRVNTSCCISSTYPVALVTNPVISHDLRKNQFVITTKGRYQLSLVTQILRNC